MHYRHTQIGTVIIIAVLAAMIFIFIPSYTTGNWHPAQLGVLAILAVVTFLFYSLTVEIKNSTFTCWFGPGLIRKSIPLADIQQAQAVRNFWLAGWGIRFMAGGYWLWNVSGLQAVELVLKNGKRFRVGTDEPEKLVQALRAFHIG
ncbi:MAG: hypothetical protein EHM72_01520 [Calditrichaeota bacterium]|nr:MAG: hypothetical protein EHM72_01520 [Calditrichota bacterium]